MKYETFYGTYDQASVAFGASYALISEILEPGNTSPTSVSSHERRTQLDSDQTLTFTTTNFEFPQTLKGSAFVNFTSAITTTGGTCSFAIEIYKDTELIASTQSGELSGSGDNKTFNARLTLPRTDITISQALRLLITNKESAATTHAFIYHDPINRDVTGYTPAGGIGNLPTITATTNPTKLSLILPFITQL